MEKRWPGWRVILPSKKDDPARGVALLLEPTSPFVSQINCRPRFVRRCWKSWLAQGSSSLRARSPGRSGGGPEKEGGGDISNNVIPLASVFQYLFTFALVSSSR